MARTAMSQRRAQRLFDRAIVEPALFEAFAKLSLRRMLRNPVMLVVEVGALFTTLLGVHAVLTEGGDAPAGFTFAVAAWLWFTVLFANFAEALAEGRGRARAVALRRVRRDVMAKTLFEPRRDAPHVPGPAAWLRRGDVVLVEKGDTIPADGEVIEGVASVDESAVTGESAPVVRESGGGRSAVTGGTRVLSDWLIVRVRVEPGESFLDRMIALVEGARRQKTPNEVALGILLAAVTIVLLMATATLLPFSLHAVAASGRGAPVPLAVLVALLVCLIPTTIGGLLPAIGIAGMDRMLEVNVIATSGRAVEAAGDVDVLLLDKTGTITLGNREAVAFVPAPGVAERELAEVAQLASLADETPEGRSIVVLAKQRFALRGPELGTRGLRLVRFSAHTRLSGADLAARSLRKGAAGAIEHFVKEHGGELPGAVRSEVERVASQGGTPLVVSDGRRVLGVVELKDVVKGGLRERFAELRQIGIRTVMLTGDHALTAAAIAAEAGVDDFLAEATPEDKLRLIRDYQAKGHLVAMAGDGINDAPALAQADVGVAMNTGTQTAKEAGNMIDLDSSPTKLLSVVQIGKQLLITRGALTTFSLGSDLAKYFAIIPAAFAASYPALGALDVMQLHSPESAVLSAVIFNALILLALIPLALRGVRYRPTSTRQLLRRNLLTYGLGGMLLPFPAIKAIDLALTALGWA
jgi:K+-transporting ATPase ATPase B chain